MLAVGAYLFKASLTKHCAIVSVYLLLFVKAKECLSRSSQFNVQMVPQ
jgi:hypothetical protein